MCLLPKVPELDLELISGKDDGLVHGDGMGSIQDGQLGLLVQQVQLDGVPVVNVGVGADVSAGAEAVNEPRLRYQVEIHRPGSHRSPAHQALALWCVMGSYR